METITRKLVLLCAIHFLNTVPVSYGWSKVLDKGIDAIPYGLDGGITTLTIKYTNITNLTGNSLMNLTQLYDLDIRRNKLLKNIDTSIFQGLVSLRFLIILGNWDLTSIDKLHDDALSNLETLEIKDCPLKVLSSELVQGAQNLEYLRLYNIRITTPPVIRNLSSLRRLDLGKNRIAEIERGYFNGLGITDLNLERNDLTAIPDLVNISQTLVWLNLNHNGGTNHFDDGIFDNFPVLRELHMWNTWHFEISDLARATDGLPSLTKLNVGDNWWTTQESIDDEALKRMPRLEMITLNYNRISVFPNFYLTKAITTIYMRYTSITKFTGDELVGLDNLRILEVDGDLPKFPNLVHARKLRHLYLFYNSNMGNVPLSALAAVPELRTLELTEINLTEFPCIACLRHTLDSLYLNRNSLTVIPEHRLYDDILCQCNNKEVPDKTNTIEKLVLSNNPEIRQLNQTFMLLFTKLEKLYIKDTGLSELPHIAHLRNSLILLDAAENSVRHIPEHYFSGMSNIEEIYLSYNQLTAFPAFANRMYTAILALSYNSITQVLTKDVINLPYLEELKLDHNKIKVFEFFYRPYYLEYLSLSYNQLPMLLNGSVTGQSWYTLNVHIDNNPLLCTKESICWLKSEKIKSTRDAVVHLSEKPCFRPARFISKKWSSIKKSEACDDNNVLADEYICPDYIGAASPCPSFNVTYNICEPPCCRQVEYGGDCIRRIASMYVKNNTESCCTSFVQKSVSVAHVGNWDRYTVDSHSMCAKNCTYSPTCQAFIFTTDTQDCLLLYDANLTY